MHTTCADSATVQALAHEGLQFMLPGTGTHRGIQTEDQHCKLNGWIGVGPAATGAAHCGYHHRVKVAIASEVGRGEVCAIGESA